MTVLTYLWFLLPALIQTVLLVILWRRDWYRRGMVPFFVAYNLYSVVIVVPRLLLLDRPVYIQFYWSTEIMYGVLAILSLNEVFRRTFFLDYEEHPWLRLVFPLTVVMILFGLFLWWRLVYRRPTGGQLSLLSAAFVAFNEGVHSVEGILLVLFMVFWLILMPGWNRYDYGILLGFGISGLITMFADMVRFSPGHGYELWYRYAPGMAYLLVTVIWLHAFWQAPQVRLQPLMRFQTMLEHARMNNEMLTVISKWLRRR